MTNSTSAAPGSGLHGPVAAPPPDPGALLSDEQVRWVRRAVVVMTTLLIVGVVVLIGRVIYLARAGGTQAASSPMATTALLPATRLALPAGAEIKSISLSGNRLAIEHGQAATGATITILDLATGQIVSRVTIERDP